MKKNVIAIIGGMGPQASAGLVTLMVKMCNKDFGITIDSDFPEIILDSVPVPNFVSNKSNSKKALKILKSRISKLEIFNPDCFAICCNTAHILLDDLQSQTKVPFISIISEVASRVAERGIEVVGLLATPTTISSNLYQDELAKQNINTVLPSKNEIKLLDFIIRNVLSGKTTYKEKEKLKLITSSLIKKGSQGIILGCTELPLIFPKNEFNIPIFDSIDILARGLLKRVLD